MEEGTAKEEELVAQDLEQIPWSELSVKRSFLQH